MLKKNQIRNYSKKLRKSISKKSYVNFISQKVLSKLFKIILNNDYKLENIAIYFPINNEISPLKILDLKCKYDFNIGLPKTKYNTKILDFINWDGNEKLNVSNYKTLVPANSNFLILPDVIFVPMLAFDKNFNRLGYGGGYYDTTIQYLRKKKSFLAIGLSYDKQEVENVPIANHDQKMDLIVTEKRIMKKKGLYI